MRLSPWNVAGARNRVVPICMGGLASLWGGIQVHKTELASDCLDVSHHVSGTNSRMWFRQQCISLDVIRRRSHPISRCWMCHCTYTRAPVLEVCRSFRKKAHDVLDCGKSCQPITGADLELDSVFVVVSPHTPTILSSGRFVILSAPHVDIDA